MIDNLISNIKCPICYLAMVSPVRSPMIITECGHTFCEICISDLHECPICHHPIKKFIKNILMQQLVDMINQKHLIPVELNPPLPSENKLIPKIEPICTFAATGENYIKQKGYQCRTCKITGNLAICEICIKKCHKGHDVYLGSSTIELYCDCPKKCHCQSLSNLNNSMKCTYDLTYGCPIEQPMYQCEDCHITENYYICQSCAIKCHHGHNLRYIGILKDKNCHCFDHSICHITSRRPICTFKRTGESFVGQPWYHCKTCGLIDIEGCCSACAHYCHKGHNVEFNCFAGLNGNPKFFCDCGSDLYKKRCSIVNEYNDKNASYLNRCPNFLFENKNKKIKQRKYHCFTCGLFGLSGICEACAVNRHINHSIEYAGIENFCCACQSTEKCQMVMMPLIHNDRNCCDRSLLTKDDISPCYTCYTCDRLGKIQICETCAIKKHKNHDIHIISYTNFLCNE